MEKVKFVTVTRTICPRTQIHYLDAVSEDGMHWSAEMTPHQEKWLTYQKLWTRDPQQPYTQRNSYETSKIDQKN